MTRSHIPVASPAFAGNEQRYVLECLESTQISSSGKFIDQFERSFAAFTDSKHAIACSNGTTALHLAMAALGVGPGDEVIVPTLTYIATANAVTFCGATPVFCDSDETTWNIDAGKIESLITSRTRGIIAVHLYGHPADMDAISRIARSRGLFVVEDAAEAHGALYKGRKVGSLSDVATFSFFGNKIITCGEGGALTTNDAHLASKIRLLRSNGMDPTRKYWFPVIGFNYRMSNLLAAVALAQLEKFEWHQARRWEVASLYQEILSNHPSLVRLPVEMPDVTHAFWMYSVVLKNHTADERCELIARLAKDGIETRPMFYPIHTMPPYAGTRRRLPVSEQVSAAGLSLPTHALLTKDDVRFVCERLIVHAQELTVSTRTAVVAPACVPVQI